MILCRDSQQSSCFNTPVRGESSSSSLPPWIIPNNRTTNAFASPPAPAPSLAWTAAARTGAMAMTTIPGGNNGGNPGGGVGADLRGNYHQHQRDGGGAAADRTSGGADSSGAGAHGGRRDNKGTRPQHEPDTARPPQSIDNSMRGGGGGGEGGEAGAWAATDPESFLRENLSLKDLVSLAYMFNFVEAGVLGLGERKAVVQVRAMAFFEGHLRKDFM